jgi:hypothetical protein
VGLSLRNSTPKIYTYLPNRDQAHQASQADNSSLLHQAKLSKLSAPAWWIKQAFLLSLLSLLVDKYATRPVTIYNIYLPSFLLLLRLAIDLFIFYPKYYVLVCKSCAYAVAPPHLAAHIANKHTNNICSRGRLRLRFGAVTTRSFRYTLSNAFPVVRHYYVQNLTSDKRSANEYRLICVSNWKDTLCPRGCSSA